MTELHRLANKLLAGVKREYVQSSKCTDDLPQLSTVLRIQETTTTSPCNEQKRHAPESGVILQLSYAQGCYIGREPFVSEKLRQSNFDSHCVVSSELRPCGTHGWRCFSLSLALSCAKRFNARRRLSTRLCSG